MSTNPKDRVGSSKISLTRIPTTALVEMAKAGTYGNHMYDPFNWRDKDKKIGLTVYIDAILRHAYRLFDGEDVDPDSLVSHWGHIAQGSAVAIDAISLGNFVDDRPKAGLGSDYMDEFMKQYPAFRAHWDKVKIEKQRQTENSKTEWEHLGISKEEFQDRVHKMNNIHPLEESDYNEGWK